MFPQIDVRKNFLAVQVHKIKQWIMRTNDPFVSFLVFVWVGGGCGLPGRKDGGRKPDSGMWLSQASAFPTGIISQQGARSAGTGESYVLSSPQGVTAQGETSLLPEGQK